MYKDPDLETLNNMPINNCKEVADEDCIEVANVDRIEVAKKPAILI